MEVKSKLLFRMYLFLALSSGIVIELINFENSAGLGLIVYLLIMITYYLIRICSFCETKQDKPTSEE